MQFPPWTLITTLLEIFHLIAAMQKHCGCYLRKAYSQGYRIDPIIIIIILINLFYLFLAVLGLCCCARASHCGGFSCCRAQALGARAPVVVARGLSSCGWWALERRLSSCGAWAQLLRSMWDLPGPGLEPVSPALAGGFLTTAPPGKPDPIIIILHSLSTNTESTRNMETSLVIWQISLQLKVRSQITVGIKE